MVPQILHFLNLRTCESERFISNEIARSHKIVILLRNADFNLKNAVCLILKIEDLDPKGSTSDHDLGISITEHKNRTCVMMLY